MPIKFALIGATALAAVAIPAVASAQYYSGYDGYARPAYGYRYDNDDRSRWIAHERWEQRRRWEEQRRRHWEQERWEHRGWHGDRDDD